MAIPIVVGIAVAIASVTGVGAGAQGAMKIKEASDKESDAKALHEDNVARLDSASTRADGAMDTLGMLELNTLESFERFSRLVEKIQNAPEFAEMNQDVVDLSDYTPEQFKQVAIGAKSVISGLVGAAAGTAGGFAAAGATTAVVTALCSASTGTAISSLSGAAATNATLAALGGGAVAAGGGGMAVGAAVLSAASAGAAVLVGGIVINFASRKISGDAEKLYDEVKEEERNVSEVCSLLDAISSSAERYHQALSAVVSKYEKYLTTLETLTEDRSAIDWSVLSKREQLLFKNLVMLVGLLYKMCQVNLVIDDDGDGITDRVNKAGIDEMISTSQNTIQSIEN